MDNNNTVVYKAPFYHPDYITHEPGEVSWNGIEEEIKEVIKDHLKTNWDWVASGREGYIFGNHFNNNIEKDAEKCKDNIVFMLYMSKMYGLAINVMTINPMTDKIVEKISALIDENGNFY